ncbi:MAG: cellulase family glycosylhydrolase [Solirubrobacteraceae bacterium]
MSSTAAAGCRVRVATLAVLAVALMASLAMAPGASAAQVGAVADITWGQPRSAVVQEIAMLKAAGVRWIRANVNWAGLEAEGKGQISAGQLAEYDYAVDQARAAGLKVLMPISDGVPYWASADPHKYIDASSGRHWDRFYRPANMADYGDIVRYVVARYQAKGVHTFEIWNEPNTTWFWSSGPDPAAYVQMLKAGYTAAKAADPASTVLLGGLAKSDFRFLEGVYAAGGGAYFDAVAVHPYTFGVDPTVSWNGVNAGEDPNRLSLNCFPAIQEIKATMDAHGDAGKQVWITEFGYSTTTANGGVSKADQAAFLTKAYTYVERFPWVHAMFWYAARNSPYLADADNYEAQFGLMSIDFTPKPSYAALKAYALAHPAPDDITPVTFVANPAPAASGDATAAATPPAPASTPSPGASAAPEVTLAAPAAGSTFSSELPMVVTTKAGAPVRKVEFLVDGRVVATDASAPCRATWRASRRTAYGAHVISARAYDGSGRAATASVDVTRTLATPKVAVKATTRAARLVRAVRRGTVIVSGGAPRGIRRARLRFERLAASGRWRAAATQKLSLRRGRYRTTLVPRSGRWRVRIVATAPSGRRLASSYRVFVR